MPVIKPFNYVGSSDLLTQHAVNLLCDQHERSLQQHQTVSPAEAKPWPCTYLADTGTHFNLSSFLLVLLPARRKLDQALIQQCRVHAPYHGVICYLFAFVSGKQLVGHLAVLLQYVIKGNRILALPCRVEHGDQNSHLKLGARAYPLRLHHTNLLVGNNFGFY